VSSFEDIEWAIFGQLSTKTHFPACLCPPHSHLHLPGAVALTHCSSVHREHLKCGRASASGTGPPPAVGTRYPHSRKCHCVSFHGYVGIGPSGTDGSQVGPLPSPTSFSIFSWCFLVNNLYSIPRINVSFWLLPPETKYETTWWSVANQSC
jgi:hypothetical protein